MKTDMKHILWGGAAAAAVALVVAGAAFFPTIAQAQTATSTATSAVAPSVQQRGKETPTAPLGKDDARAAFAAALGITVEELDAAQVAAQSAAIDKQVADGWLTELQAEALKANLERGSRRMGDGWGRGFGAMRGSEIDFDALLADALGITVDDLNAARTQVDKDRLAQAVSNGAITQEQADMALARRALQAYVAPLMQSAYDDAVAAAVSSGVITQAQADALAAPGGFGPGMGAQMGGGRMGGYGMHGFGPDMDDDDYMDDYMGDHMDDDHRGYGHRGGGHMGGPHGGNVLPDTDDSSDDND